MWEFDDGCRLQTFDGARWKTLLADRSQFLRTMITLRDGRLLILDTEGSLLLSSNRGESFIRYTSTANDIASASCMLDREFLLRAGHLRCQFTPRESDRIIVASARLAAP